MERLSFISFEITNGKYRGFISVDAAIKDSINPDVKINKALRVYERFIKRLRLLTRDMEAKRRKSKLISAREMWNIGDLVFGLKDALAALSLQLDGVYYHLERDLGVKRKWLEKAIIFRRYIPSVDMIPATLNWGKCEKGTKKVALKLVSEYIPT